MQDPHGSITPSPLDNMRGLEYYLHDMMHNPSTDGQDQPGKGDDDPDWLSWLICVCVFVVCCVRVLLISSLLTVDWCSRELRARSQSLYRASANHRHTHTLFCRFRMLRLSLSLSSGVTWYLPESIIGPCDVICYFVGYSMAAPPT